MDPLIVLTTLPDAPSAQQLATLLVDSGLAACVNILAPAQSVYRWQGKLETSQEVPLLIKTRAACYAAVEAAIKNHHPYQLPEIIAIPVTHGLPDYLAWIATQTQGAACAVDAAATLPRAGQEH